LTPVDNVCILNKSTTPFYMTSTTVKKSKRPLYKDLATTNEGLSRRVKNLEQEVTVLFAIAAGLVVTAILF